MMPSAVHLWLQAMLDVIVQAGGVQRAEWRLAAKAGKSISLAGEAAAPLGC
jgi:hypothetical protein